MPAVSVADARQKLAEGAPLIDVRMPEEFVDAHAEGARNCPLPALRQCAAELAQLPEVYVMCRSGGRSASAVSVLRSAGVNAINVSGGLIAWHASGLPMA